MNGTQICSIKWKTKTASKALLKESQLCVKTETCQRVCKTLALKNSGLWFRWRTSRRTHSRSTISLQSSGNNKTQRLILASQQRQGVPQSAASTTWVGLRQTSIPWINLQTYLSRSTCLGVLRKSRRQFRRHRYNSPTISWAAISQTSNSFLLETRHPHTLNEICWPILTAEGVPSISLCQLLKSKCRSHLVSTYSSTASAMTRQRQCPQLSA